MKSHRLPAARVAGLAKSAAPPPRGGGRGRAEGDPLCSPPPRSRPAESVERARSLRPASSFRSRSAYDNILYIVAGEVVAAVGGTTWEAFVRDRLLRPLGMK